MTDSELFSKLKQAQKEFEALGTPQHLITSGDCILNDVWMKFSDKEFVEHKHFLKNLQEDMKECNRVHREYIKKFGKKK